MKKVERAIAEMFRVCRRSGFVVIAYLNENGLKKYKHKSDDDRTFFKKIYGCLMKYGPSIRKVDTEYNFIFICRNTNQTARLK